MAFTQDFRTQRRNYNDGDTRLGEKDRLWYDSITNSIRIGDGETPGGVAVGGAGGSSYTLPTATTTVKGGVKIDGTTITINNQVISGFSGSYNDLTNKPTIPTNTNQLTNGAGFITGYTETDPVFVGHASYNITSTQITNWDTAYGWGDHAGAGYLTSVGTISYNDLSNKPTLFSGSYTDLSNKPTLFSGSYNDLTDKPNLSSTYQFSVAGDDSTQRLISTGETVKFIGAGGITTSSDAEGAVTITQGSTDNIIKVAGSFGTESPFKSEVVADLATGVRISTWWGLPAFATEERWQFDYDGILTFPDGTEQATAWTGTSTTLQWTAAEFFPSAPAQTTITAGDGAVDINLVTGIPGSSTSVNWSFTNQGTIEFPDSTTQYSAYTGDSSTTEALTIGTGLSGTSFNGSTAVTIALDDNYGDTKNPYASKTAKYFLAAPNADNGAPTFRAIVASDIPTLNQNTTGSAATLTTARNINGVAFNGSADITVTAAAGTLSGNTLASGVTASSLTSVGTLTNLSVTNTITGSVSGNAGTATKLATARAINGVDFDGSAAITITAAAGTLTGTTLNSTVVSSSLTSVGTLTSLTSSGLVRFNNAGVGASYNAAGNSVNIGGVLGVASNIYANGNIDIVAGSAYYIGGNTVLNGNTLGSNIVNSSLTSVGTLTSLSSGAITTTGTLALNASGGITTNQTTFPLVNTTATTVNFAGAATALNMGASTGTTTINNNLSMASGKTIGTTASITSNAATAFIAGTAAESGVALQMPLEGALRNLTNGLTNMYFDVSTGGTTQGQFQFRSSNAFTNVLTMSPTAFNVNTGATVTARTPSLGRLPFNSAIDTELTIDDMRFRISNQGGIFPQVIGNGSSRNLAWTVVAARNGSAIQQTGSTGTIVSSSAWTSLYTAAGMDASGDTYTATLQDKAAGRIYRVTFMRSDNGTTTGYNIIAERIL